MSNTERESMPYDVVIVGAGPAGLSAAIKIKQLDSNLDVVVLEKGSEVGAHILSGAVLDPSALNALIPDWKEKGAPIKVEVKEDIFLNLTETKASKIPNFLMPPLMNNHGNYIVSMGNVCRWMAEQAESIGVEIFPGMSCSELVYGEDGEVKGVVAGEFGKNADGTEGAGYEPGMELHGKYVLLSEGVRGSLSKEVISKYKLDAKSDVPKFGLGMKEIWEVKPENHNEGEVTHTMGWPMSKDSGGSTRSAAFTAATRVEKSSLEAATPTMVALSSVTSVVTSLLLFLIGSLLFANIKGAVIRKSANVKLRITLVVFMGYSFKFNQRYNQMNK